MKKLLFIPLLLALFSCGGKTTCWFYYQCDTGCLEQIGEEYFCTHCCKAKSQKPEGHEALDKGAKPIKITEERLKELKAHE